MNAFLRTMLGQLCGSDLERDLELNIGDSIRDWPDNVPSMIAQESIKLIRREHLFQDSVNCQCHILQQIRPIIRFQGKFQSIADGHKWPVSSFLITPLQIAFDLDLNARDGGHFEYTLCPVAVGQASFLK